MRKCRSTLLYSALFDLAATFAMAHAQAPVAIPPGGKPVPWAAVSIHPSDPARNQANDGWSDQPNGISGTGMSVRQMLSQAYHFGFMPFRDEELEGLPSWASTARYDVRERVDADDVETFRKLSGMTMADTLAAFAARQYTGEMLMGQAVLAERFHLKAHYDVRSRRVYLLSVDKGGPHLKATANTSNEGTMSFGNGMLSGKGVPIAAMVNLLAYPAERVVVDRTALPGRFDFELHFAPSNAGVSTEPSTLPDFFSAVRQELGLKLESSRADVPVLVIDHIEEPTPN